MYYEVAGCGMPVLFVHGGLGGGAGSATFRQHHMAELTRQAQVIAFDRRAAGGSETPAAGYSFDQFAGDIFALLDHLGHRRAVLMGHSAGGPQVLQAALASPERVIGLILSSTASQTVNVPPELAALVTFLGTDGLTSLQAMLAGRQSEAPSEGSAGFPAPAAQFGGVLQTYLAYHLHGDPIAPRLGEITVPALILHGTSDQEVPYAEAERLHAGLPQACLVPFAGGGHGIMVTHAEAYRRAISEFLQGLAADA